MGTRKFGNEIFKSFAQTRKKSSANESAERLRSRGDRVRVVKAGIGYEIFTKKGRKRRDN
jgi:hypothetical protein